MDDRQWCSIYGYDIPSKHICEVGVCFNPHREEQVLQGTLDDRLAKAEETRKILRHWH